MENKKTNIFKKWWFWLIIISVIFAIVCLLVAFVNYDSDDSDDSNESNTRSSYNSERGNSTDESRNDDNSPENSDIQEKELSKSETFILQLASLIKENLVFDVGDYIKGEIPAGEYAFIKLDDGGSYYCEKDAAGEIIDNENFSSFGYVKVHAAGNLETRGILVNIAAFERLNVSGAKEIYEIINEITDYNQAGFYKVGVDIEPGKYVVESMGSGYWAILKGPIGNSDIVDNDNYNGKAIINLKKGQYLEISRSSIRKA